MNAALLREVPKNDNALEKQREVEGTQERKQSDYAPDLAHIATLITAMALLGHTVIRGRAGDFTVTKWGLSRYCADAAELQAFAERVGVTA